jgi:tetratricopeptide (TPR) repeat protein
MKTLTTFLLAAAAALGTVQEARIDPEAFTRARAAFNDSRLEQARALYYEACSEVVERAGPQLPECLVSMGAAAARTGRLDEALSLVTRALGVSEPRSTTGVSARYHLAAIYQNLDRLPEAKEAAVQAVTAARAIFGDDHPDTLRSIALYGQILVRSGESKSGEELLRGALQVARFRESSLSEIVFLQGELAIALVFRGALGDAVPLIQDNLKMLSANLDPIHPMLADTLLELAAIYRRSGNVSRAVPLTRRAVHIYEMSGGPDCLELAVALTEQGLEGLADRSPLSAERLLQRALDILEKRLPPNHSQVLAIQYDLVLALIAERRYAKAEPLLRGLIERGRGHIPQSPDLPVHLATLAQLYMRSKRPAEGIKTYDECVSLFERQNRLTSEYRAVLLAYAAALRQRDRSASQQLELRAKLLPQGKHAR